MKKQIKLCYKPDEANFIISVLLDMVGHYSKAIKTLKLISETSPDIKAKKQASSARKILIKNLTKLVDITKDPVKKRR